MRRFLIFKKLVGGSFTSLGSCLITEDLGVIFTSQELIEGSFNTKGYYISPTSLERDYVKISSFSQEFFDAPGDRTKNLAPYVYQIELEETEKFAE